MQKWPPDEAVAFGFAREAKNLSQDVPAAGMGRTGLRAARAEIISNEFPRPGWRG